jgi:hypothetical protein
MRATVGPEQHGVTRTALLRDTFGSRPMQQSLDSGLTCAQSGQRMHGPGFSYLTAERTLKRADCFAAYDIRSK